jgi:ribonucleoside-diphosphate reductase alpha chain
LTTITKNKGKRQLPFDKERLINFIDNITKEFPKINTDEYKQRIVSIIESENKFRAAEITKKLILNASDNISIEEPDWTYVAARIYLKQLYKEAAYNRSYDEDNKYGDFYGLLKILGERGIYSELILKEYSKNEIKQAKSFIVSDRDKLFTYVGLRTLVERYLAKDYDGKIFELPQERYLVIAMHLMSQEDKSKRMGLVKEAYWAVSNQYMTVATPTFAQAGKPNAQLSSCFVDTVSDSLRGIYDSNTDVATLSSHGGGIGTYLGKIRSKGSDIRGTKGASGGVIPWMKQLDNTATAVDQLGTRTGAIVSYLDVWHKDIFAFLDARLNNGDERQRTHNLFLGACIPDLFMEQVEKRGDWYLFDPHEVKTIMGYSLEDYYDEHEGYGSFRDKYNECVQNNNLSKERVSAMEIMKRIMKSQLETGLPFMFYRDEVNRKNPNKHVGMIYSSNVCSEIALNMSPTTVTEEQTKDGKIIVTKEPGDFVVCNLSSIQLGNAVRDNVLNRLVPIQIRMLDNVIDLNSLPVQQAQITNKKYRSIGMGTFDWAHLLAAKQIKWESQEAVDYADKLYEKINYLAIKASNELAIEKSSYSLFEGSDWWTGEYFYQRDYGTDKIDDSDRFVTNEQWKDLTESVAEYGVRNGNLMANAPTGSTSLLANGTATTDPIYNRLYFEEKKNYKIPVVAPELSPKTMWYYKSAHEIDQLWSVKQVAARQRHIDQSQSFNLYIKPNIKAKDLLNLHLTAWKSHIKTTYYVRSQAIDVQDCDACAS